MCWSCGWYCNKSVIVLGSCWHAAKLLHILCLDLGFFYCILCKGFIQFCFRICVKGILESNTIMLPTLWRLIHAWIVMPYNSVKLLRLLMN